MELFKFINPMTCVCGEEIEDLVTRCNECFGWFHCGCVNVQVFAEYTCKFCLDRIGIQPKKATIMCSVLTAYWQSQKRVMMSEKEREMRAENVLVEERREKQRNAIKYFALMKSRKKRQQDLEEGRKYQNRLMKKKRQEQNYETRREREASEKRTREETESAKRKQSEQESQERRERRVKFQTKH